MEEKTMKKTLILTILALLPAFLGAMQTQESGIKAPVTWIDSIPVELRKEIFKFLDSEGSSYIENIKKFYASSPFAQKSIDTTKAMLSYVIKSHKLWPSMFMEDVQALKKYPIFENPELQTWITLESIKLSEQESVRLAAAAGDLETVQHYIDRGVDINAEDPFDSTALSRVLSASQSRIDNKKRIAIVSALLNAGANPNIGKINVGRSGTKWSILKYVRAIFWDETLATLENLLMQHGAQL
jgi:hypothetical protein